MAERNITRAAQVMGVTPSAVSHALQRLRQTLDDPLFDRRPEGMVPTQRARELLPIVAEALDNLRRGLVLYREFEPSTAKRRFTIRQSDFLSDSLLPRLCARVRSEAPGVALIIDRLLADEEIGFGPGDIQLRVGASVAGNAGWKSRRLWQDPFAVAMRPGHPAAGDGLTLEQFAALDFIDVSSAQIDQRNLDEALRRKGLSRRASVTIPTLAGVVAIVAHTDLCAVLPRRWVSLHSAASELVTSLLPVDGVDYAIDMIWHVRDEKDAGHRWLRQLIEEEFDVLYSPPSGQHQKRRVGHSPSRLDVAPTIAAE